MSLRVRLLAPLLVALVALAGCDHSISSGAADSAGNAGTPSFGQFTDVPIPDGARMDAGHSLLVGPGDNWVGRLVFNVRWSSGPALFDFYKAKMPGFQWQEISSTRADISIMTWQRGGRVATIQIEETTFGAQVTINMGQVTGGGSSAGAAPPPPAPPGSANPQPGQPTVIQSPNAAPLGTTPSAPPVSQQPLQ